MNALAIASINPQSVNTVYNTAYGDRTTLTQLVGYLKEFLAELDPEIAGVTVVHGPNRAGDIPHSLASIEKAKRLLGYNAKFSIQQGLKEAVAWYYANLK
jgi:UDP-N-acetylglucosamine 4-epimerase